MTGSALQRRSLLQELALRGIRITGQRKILVETIQESDRHLDAASLLELARRRDEGINRATVYRTLELLKKLRLIDELDLMHLNGEKHFYEAGPTSIMYTWRVSNAEGLRSIPARCSSS